MLTAQFPLRKLAQTNLPYTTRDTTVKYLPPLDRVNVVRLVDLGGLFNCVLLSCHLRVLE